MKFRIKHILYIFLGLFAALILIDLVRISLYKTFPSLPENRIDRRVNRIYYDLVNDSSQIKWNTLKGTLEYINKQYDVSDFDLSTLLRIVYDYSDKFPDSIKAEIKSTLLKFRYWMDEPGENGMCYWSENHQILYASAEYLVGQLYPDEIFTNSGLTGKQHMVKATKRILDWLEMRWKFGFSEFYSNVYYNEDIAGIINLIDYAKDKEIEKKSEIIMDLLMYDIASQKYNNTFASVSGRIYERNRKTANSSVNRLTDFLWNGKKSSLIHLNYGFTVSKNYHIPQALFEIGKDKSNLVIKQCNGINISQLKTEGYWGSDEKSIMMQWGMEAFSNPEIVGNTLSYIRRNNMFSNEFVAPMKYFDFTIFKLFHLEPWLSSMLKPQTNGAAIQQANTYTYKTKDYSIYSVQNYFPGDYANQIHVTGMNVGESFCVFHTHPAVEQNIHKESPNYWVGYGRLPHVVQDSSISMSIYNLPAKKGLIEMDMINYTHAYFPKEQFDSVMIIKNYAFGKKGKTYCALIGKNNFYYKQNSTDDLIQPGRQTFWIIEAGCEEKDGSFENFRSRILNNKISFDENNLALIYSSVGKELKLKYCGTFSINNSVINTNYNRYDSPYVKAKFKPDSLEFKFNKKFLRLDFYKMKREYN